MPQNGRETARAQRRYSARLVVPKELRSIVGEAELEMQLGHDRRQALARLPGAVAGLRAKIAVASRNVRELHGVEP